jgi:hypothetical protein
MTTIIRNVGINKGTPRIWLEGKKLDAIGFTARTRYTVQVLPKSIKLIACEDGEKAVSGKNLTPDYRMPVIDLHNAALADWLGSCGSVTVQFKQGQITIKRIEPEQVEEPEPVVLAEPVKAPKVAKAPKAPKPKPQPRDQLGLF